MATTTTRKPRPSRSKKAKGQTLEQRAMLVDLTIRQWTAAKNDRKVSDEVAQTHGSDRNMGHYYKQLLGHEALDKVRRIGNAAFNEHYLLTLPWFDSGSRVLSGAGYFKYMEKMRAYEVDYGKAVEEFIVNYDDYVEDAKARLNGMFNPDEYPTHSDISAKFAFMYSIFPLPTAGDFRVQLGTGEVDRIRADIEANTQQAMRRAMIEVAERIKLVVEHMAERLRAYNGQREGSFRDTLVSNVQDVTALVPILNVTADPRITAIAQEIDAVLCQHPAETLRTDETAREATAAAAEAILEKMKEFAL